MVSILVYIAIIIGSLIAGALVIFLWLAIYDSFKNRKLRKKIPKDSESLANPGKIEIDEKEVQKNDRERERKFREFEKLRRIAEKGEGDRNIDKRFGTAERINKPTGQELLSTKPDPIYSRQFNEDFEPPRENKQSFKLHKPTDL